MLRAGENHGFIADLGFFHFLSKRSHLLRWNHGIILAGKGNNFRLHHARLRRGLRRQAAMVAGYHFQVLAQPRHLQRHAAAETITQRGDITGVHAHLPPEKLQRGIETRLGQRQVLRHLAGKFSGFIRMMRLLPIPIHIQRQGGIAQLRQHPGALARILVMPPPFVHHQHAGPLPLDCIVIGEIPFQRFPVIAVRHFLSLHHCLHPRAQE